MAVRVHDELILLATDLASNDLRFFHDLKDQREQVGVTREQMAQELGWTVGQVAEFEWDGCEFTFRDARLYSIALASMVLERGANA